jgi:hypothetical protein
MVKTSLNIILNMKHENKINMQNMLDTILNF